MNEIDEMLSFDPLGCAMELTSMDYKEDDGVGALGMLLAIQHAETMREKLSELTDTYHNMDFTNACRIFTDAMGFTLVHEHDFDGRLRDLDEPQPEVYRLFWRDGILLSVDSHYGKLNSADAHFNFKPFDEESIKEFRTIGMSYSVHAESYDERGELVYIAALDARQGLRHNIDHLACLGEFLNPWLEAPAMFLGGYDEERSLRSSTNSIIWLDEFHKVTQDRIDTLPEEVRTAINCVE